MVACRLFGHRWTFSCDGATVHWRCTRGCGAAGARQYADRREAVRHFHHYTREPRPPIGVPRALGGAAPRRPQPGRDAARQRAARRHAAGRSRS
jgi:hypothetical protein